MTASPDPIPPDPMPSDQVTAGLNRGGSTPLYLQLAALLRDKIMHGEWQPDQKIPSENELNRIYGISRMTARQVLALLVQENLLFRVQGKGTFVAAGVKIATRSPAYQGLREQLERTGYATTRVLSTDTLPSNARVAEHLHLPTGELVHRLRRVRLVDQQPISLHTSYVPVRFAPDLPDADLENRQLCQILEQQHRLRMSRVTETLESSLPTPDDAKALHARRTTPLLLLRQTITDPTGRRFEYSQILFHGDKIKLEFHYDR